MKLQQKTYLTYAILFIIIFVFVGIGGFYSGIIYQKTHSNQFLRSRQSVRYGFMPRRTGMGKMFNGFRNNFTSGQITNISGNQITLKLFDGTTKTVTLSSSTQYIQISSGTQNSMKQGEMVSIISQNQNGSTNAQIVRINTQ